MGITIRKSHIKKRVAFILEGLAGLVILFFVSSFIGEFFLPAAAAVVLLCAIADISSYISYRSTSIEAAEKGVIFRSGMLSKREVTYPYNKITSTRVDTSLGDRILGLKTLMIDTAGEAGMDLVITDLPAGDCELFYKELNERTSTHKAQGND
jgi:putative membrane protein